MRIFVSWSGELSKNAAAILHKYLPCMIQGLSIFMSKHDLESGSRWSIELAKELDETNFGIICLTPENLNKPWILFEAGALTKHIEGRVCGLLLNNLKPTDISGPLSQFQNRIFNEAEFYMLVKDINVKVVPTLSEQQLDMVFNKWWPDIAHDYQDILSSIPITPTISPHRDQQEILEEILGKVRSFERALENTRPINVMEDVVWGSNIIKAQKELAKNYMMQRKYPEAEEILRKSLNMEPERIDIRLDLAKVLMMQRKLHEAEMILQECISLYPKDMKIRSEYAEFLRSQDRNEEAHSVLLDI